MFSHRNISICITCSDVDNLVHTNIEDAITNLGGW